MYKTKIMGDYVDGVSDWVWVEQDTGVWHWPMSDWLNLKEKYIKHCKKFDVVVQAGGACGMYPRLMSDFFQTVYTFEPDSYNFHCLVNNCQKDNIIKIQAALGNGGPPLKLHISDRSNSGMHRIKGDPGIVPIIRLDDLNLQACDMLQYDVEEYELEALKGSEQTIKKFSPLIICECLHANYHDQILAFLQPYGYKWIDSQGCDVFYGV